MTTAHVRDKRRPDAARLAAALGRAEAAFLAAYDAANALGDCVVSDEAEKASESSRVDIWVTDFLRRLYPLCGDAVRAGTEECDGADATTCPDLCTASCTCPVCGNGVVEPGEQCDGRTTPCVPASARHATASVPPCGDNVREPASSATARPRVRDIFGFREHLRAAWPAAGVWMLLDSGVFAGVRDSLLPGFHCVSTGGPHVQPLREPERGSPHVGEDLRRALSVAAQTNVGTSSPNSSCPAVW